MLDELAVTNLGIIEQARVTPGTGMVVVSGETGAGKTLLLGALRMLVGAPARSAMIGPHGDEATVEGRFILDDAELVISRRIHGRGSRSYINGKMVPARTLVARFDGRVEIVGQHDPLSLTRPKALRTLLDLRLDSPEHLSDYRAAWRRAREIEEIASSPGGDLRALQREQDLLSYQVREIEEADFRIGDDEELERLAHRLGNAEQIVELLSSVRRYLSAARDRVGPAVADLRRVFDLDPSQGDLLEMLEGLDATLTEAVGGAREAWENIDTDPETLAAINDRLTLLGDLRRKYGADIAEILAYRENARIRYGQVTELLDRAASIDRERADAARMLEETGRELRAARQRAAALIAGDAAAHLRELGFSEPVVRIDVGESSPRTAGADTVDLLFASDARLEPGPVGRVASGGELSRLVLSLRLASGSSDARLVAFDEIDAGVGGATALAMGAKLARLATNRQALCVSHLPQVAAHADTHIVVDRDGAGATVRTLDEEGRIRELSRMLSGLEDSDRGYRHARELLAVARAHRHPATGRG